MADAPAGLLPPDHSMPPQDRDFWIAVGLWGAALVTVLGCGLYAFIEQSYWYGAGFTGLGLVGLVYLTLHLKGRKLTPKVGVMVTTLAITWALIAYQIFHTLNTNSKVVSLEISFAARKSTLTEWLKMAQQQQHQAIAERDQLARQLATTQTRLRVVQQNASTIAAAPPVPPKNFYSQKQKDELADLIEALVSQLDRCDAEIVQIISAPDFPPAPGVMGSMTFHTLQQQVDVMTAGAIIPLRKPDDERRLVGRTR